MNEDDQKAYKELMGLPDDAVLAPLDLDFCAAWVGGQFDDRVQNFKGENSHGY
jgi:hypothetical protein